MSILSVRQTGVCAGTPTNLKTAEDMLAKMSMTLSDICGGLLFLFVSFFLSYYLQKCLPWTTYLGSSF